METSIPVFLSFSSLLNIIIVLFTSIANKILVSKKKLSTTNNNYFDLDLESIKSNKLQRAINDDIKSGKYNNKSSTGIIVDDEDYSNVDDPLISRDKVAMK